MTDLPDGRIAPIAGGDVAESTGNDAFGRVPVDRSRLYLTGYSMGGYGAYRLASLYPDLFAAAAVWAGYTGEFLGRRRRRGRRGRRGHRPSRRGRTAGPTSATRSI